MHRWIQLPSKEANVLIEKGKIGVSQGFKFTRDGLDFVEYHIDDHPTFLEIGAANHRFGGALSVRKKEDEIPILLFGQDEAIFKQYLSWWKAWAAPGGLKAMSPKDDGLAVMISAIVSRDLGFGVEWTDDLMKKVNEYQKGKKYSDREAAICLNATDEKLPLTSSPLVVEFEHGAHNEGYWKYENIYKQVEDS